MDVSGANSDDHVGTRSLVAEELVDDFISFTDDLGKASAISVGADIASFSKQDVDHSGEGDLQENFFANSVGSPTTVASEDLHVTRLVEQDFQAVSSDVASSSSGGVVNFDAVLNVAFNTVNQEQPKQVWETGIWKYILVMIVQGWILVFGDHRSADQSLRSGHGTTIARCRAHRCAEEESFSELQFYGCGFFQTRRALERSERGRFAEEHQAVDRCNEQVGWQLHFFQ